MDMGDAPIVALDGDARRLRPPFRHAGPGFGGLGFDGLGDEKDGQDAGERQVESHGGQLTRIAGACHPFCPGAGQGRANGSSRSERPAVSGMKRSAARPTRQAAIIRKAGMSSLPVQEMRPLPIAGAVPPNKDVETL